MFGKEGPDPNVRQAGGTGTAEVDHVGEQEPRKGFSIETEWHSARCGDLHGGDFLPFEVTAGTNHAYHFTRR